MWRALQSVRVDIIVLTILLAGLAWCDAPLFDVLLTLCGVVR